MAQRVKRDDTVVVISGKDKGKQGKVIRVLTDEERVVVEGVNVITRHVKSRRGARQAGIIKQEAPVHKSKVKQVCPICSKPARFGARILEEGTKARYCKLCQQVLT
jgi:large subunit ribosomal protein L24